MEGLTGQDFHRMKIGVFGGTFDPPHLGHLILAAEAVDQLKLERLVWVLTSTPPHKSRGSITSIQDRLDMTLLMVEQDPNFTFSRVDIDRPGPHYSVDMIKLLQEVYQDAELCFLMGGDSLHDLPGWYHANELVAICSSFGVMRRPDDQVDLDSLEQVLPGIRRKVEFIRSPLLEISSHEIRNRIRENRTYRFFLLPEVYQMINQRRLYTAG